MICINSSIHLKLLRNCAKVNCLLRGYCNGTSSLFKRYSQDEQVEILNTLHKCAEENIARYSLSEKRLKNIQHYLKANEKFTNLDEVLEVNGIGVSALNKICKNILKNDQNAEEPKVKAVVGLLSPPLDKNMQMSVTTTVGLTIGFNAISWAKLDCGSRVLPEWDVYDLGSIVEKKVDLHNIYTVATEVCSLISNADIYLMENTNWSNLNTKIPLHFHIRKALLTTAIMTIFNSRHKTKGITEELLENRVYFLKSFTPARLFQTLIGLEKVSAQSIVEDIFEKKPDVRYSDLSIPEELYDSYKILDGHLKENMSQSLLLVITFTELVLYNNTKAMSILAQRSNKKKNAILDSP